MADFFVDLVNISITASYIIAAVILFRALFKKIPRKFICLLWGIAGIRLVFPFSIESALSLIPSTKTIPDDIVMSYAPTISSGIEIINKSVNPIISEAFTPNAGDSVNPLQVVTSVCSVIWTAGIIAILLYGIISYIRVKKSVSTAVLLNSNVWQSESVVSPFILGIIKPKIYIPFNMDEETRNYVVAHENAHLCRRDHWIKPLGFLVLAVYWFNPLVWVAYILLCRDIEAACDEKVVSQMDGETRKEYATALLECAVNRRRIAACPLAFGEVSVKNRIRNVMNYKKPAFWVIILAVVACIVAAVCFLTNPETNEYYDCGYALRVAFGETEGEYYRLNNGISGKLYGSETFEITVVDLQSGSVEIKFSEKVLESIEKNFYDDLQSGKEKIKALKVDFGDSKTVFYGDDHEDKVTFTVEKKQSLDDAITAAIMEHNSGSYKKGAYACSYHEVLATESSGDASSDEIETVTAYLNAAYGEYEMKNGAVESVSGGSGPIALTFRVEATEYVLIEYWEAEDGSNHADSIREKFPSGVAESVIKDPYSVSEQCKAKAEAYFEEKISLSENKVYSGKAYTTCEDVEIILDGIWFEEYNSAVNFSLKNNSAETVTTGRPFFVRRYENGEWVSCAAVEELYWTMEGLLILPGQTRDLPCVLSYFDISKNGYYRLEKSFYANGEEHTAYVEFAVDNGESTEKLELPAGSSMIVPESLYTVYDNRVASKRSDSWEFFERKGIYALIEYEGDIEPIPGVIIKTKADFDKFVEEMTPYFELNDAPEGMSFMGRAKMFDEEFFKENSLIIMHVKENTWSVTHTLGDISLHHQKAPEESRQESEGYALSFQVHRNLPGEDADAESERFITVAMDKAAIGEVNSCYITYGEDISAPKETYRFVSNGLINGTVILYADNKMMFNYSLLSSYIPYGTYAADNGKLVMKTDDGRFTYTFKVDGDTLVFDAAHSSELPEYNYGNGTKFKPVPDGAVFVKD